MSKTTARLPVAAGGPGIRPGLSKRLRPARWGKVRTPRSEVGLATDGGMAGRTLSQNGRFSTKKSGQFRGLTKDALLHSHVNRVTFSLTSTLPMANPGCLCAVIVAGWRAGRLAL